MSEPLLPPPPITTIIYTHPSDEELYAGVRDLPC